MYSEKVDGVTTDCNAAGSPCVVVALRYTGEAGIDASDVREGTLDATEREDAPRE